MSWEEIIDILLDFDKKVLVLLCAKLIRMHNSWNAGELLNELKNLQK